MRSKRPDTVGDDRVRPGHAAHDWETRTWSDSPDPGEDYNCRCWAEPATPEQIEKKKKQRCFKNLPWEEEAKENIKLYENNIEYPYIDSTFNITVGHGINIDKEDTFSDLPWKLNKEGGSPATKENIEAAYEELTKQKSNANNINYKKINGKTQKTFNKRADKQKGWSQLVLPATESTQIFEEKLRYFRETLSAKKFADFNCFPPKAKIALMDMIFNIGETKFSLNNWPDLFKAINQRDWKAAAKECHRLDVSEKRNGKTRELFLESAEIEQ